jgi:hypothetical protein
MPHQLHPSNENQYQIIRILGWPQRWSGCCEVEKTFLLPVTEFEPRIGQPVISYPFISVFLKI